MLSYNEYLEERVMSIAAATDPHKYTRKIGNDRHEKTIMGYPKIKP